MRQPGSAQAPVYPCLEVTAATCAARASTRGARARTARGATAVRRAADTAPAATERRCASWRLATTGVIAAQRAGARWVARCGAATRLREPTSTAAIFETRDTLGERHAVADRPARFRPVQRQKRVAVGAADGDASGCAGGRPCPPCSPGGQLRPQRVAPACRMLPTAPPHNRRASCRRAGGLHLSAAAPPPPPPRQRRSRRGPAWRTGRGCTLSCPSSASGAPRLRARARGAWRERRRSRPLRASLR